MMGPFRRQVRHARDSTAKALRAPFLAGLDPLVRPTGMLGKSPSWLPTDSTIDLRRNGVSSPVDFISLVDKVLFCAVI